MTPKAHQFKSLHNKSPHMVNWNRPHRHKRRGSIKVRLCFESSGKSIIRWSSLMRQISSLHKTLHPTPQFVLCVTTAMRRLTGRAFHGLGLRIPLINLLTSCDRSATEPSDQGWTDTTAVPLLPQTFLVTTERRKRPLERQLKRDSRD